MAKARGGWMEIKYSICMVNLNMERTLKVALESVLNQIDETYEVIVVDDGSRDRSVEILRDLEARYSALKVFELNRNRKRDLAETRNISCSHAKGEYLILHIDCDDYWYPHIQDFISCFHEIEKIFGHDFLLSGQQINVGSREFLLKHGPYRTGHTGEDRDLWYRMALLGRWLLVDHVVFRDRLPLTSRQVFRKSFFLSAITVRDEMRAETKLSEYYFDLIRPKLERSLKYRLYLFFVAVLLRPFLRFWTKIDKVEGDLSWNELKSKALETGTIKDYLVRHNQALPKGISEHSKWLFSNSSNEFIYLNYFVKNMGE